MTLEQNFRPLPKRWREPVEIPGDIDRELSDFSPFMRQLLFNRGFFTREAAADFIAGTISAPTDPTLLTGMDQAVSRLRRAITEDQLITIYGDYDADGVTSSALLYLFLSALSARVRVYIPNRYDEGYGLNDDAIRQLAAEGTDLIITVDCGVRAVGEITLANELGMDVIVTDHHQPGKILPPAEAVIDPKQKGDLYPEKNLAGVGLAYKLAQAYLTVYPQEGVDPAEWLDLVAIGTVADLTELKGENRVLVRAGLEIIRRQPRQGIYSLAKASGLDLLKCDASTIGFGLGPRLNAAGRLDSALTAFELLTTQDIFEAGQLAQKLDSYNRERQEMTQKIRDTAVTRVLSENPDAMLFFASDPDFSEGVVGLAASRLSEAYHRPAVIGHQGETLTVASCRSIPGFDIIRALDACSEWLVKHGGHAAAAGLTVRNEDVGAFIARLTEIAEEELKNLELMPVLDIDRKIELGKLHPKYIPGILEDLHMLEPTGRGNPEPVFASYNVPVGQARTVGNDGAHLKLTLRPGSYAFDAIAFRQGYWHENLPDRVDIAYRFELNEYNGRTTLQLNIKDIKASEIAD